MRDFKPRQPPPLTPFDETRLAPNRASAPAASSAFEVTSAGAFVLESVPEARLTSPWSVRLGVSCLVAADNATNAEQATVDVLGDFDTQGYVLRIKLDGALSRSLPGHQKERAFPKLTDLHDPWARLEAGRHRVAVFAARVNDGQIPIDGSGKPAVTFCDFEVEANGVVVLSDRMSDVALVGPEGTLHGDAARPLVQAYWVRPALANATLHAPKAKLVIEQPDGQRDVEELGVGAYRLAPAPGAPSFRGGDYRLWTEMADTPSVGTLPSASNVSSASVDERTVHVITINPE